MLLPPGGDWRAKRTKSRIEHLNNRLKRSGFIQSDSPSMNVLAYNADTSLFKAVLLNENHSLRCLFPNQHFTPYFLRVRHITLTFVTRTHEILYLVCYSRTLTKLLLLHTNNNCLDVFFLYVHLQRYVCY